MYHSAVLQTCQCEANFRKQWHGDGSLTCVYHMPFNYISVALPASIAVPLALAGIIGLLLWRMRRAADPASYKHKGPPGEAPSLFPACRRQSFACSNLYSATPL